jgi:hypothetical protein
MTTPRLSLAGAVAVALLASGCDDASTALAVAAGAPSAIASFRGVTAQIPGIQDYVAIASARGNELKLVDPNQDRPILGPTLTFPLSIPTDPRPLRLAATPLGDRVDPANPSSALRTDVADLLAVASPTTIAGPAVEVVVTWNTTNRTLPAIQLAPAGEVLALAAGPIPGRSGAARLVAAIATATGGQLAVIDVTRAADGGITPGASVLKPLVAPVGPFDAADLAFSPDGSRLFVATADQLAADGTRAVFGVAQLAVDANAAVDWPVTVIDARAPTRLVAAAEVGERSLTDPFVFGPAALRVYAALEPSGCGDTKAMRCGIVTLDPAIPGLAPDPTSQLDPAQGFDPTRGMPYRAPIVIPGIPQDISISFAPANRAQGTPCSDLAVPGARLFVAGASRCTTAVAAIPSTDGSVYVVDLGRFGIPNDRNLADLSQRTQVTNIVSAGVVAEFPAPVTPGFTDTDVWTLESQAILPGLVTPAQQARRGIVANVGGTVYLAAQTALGAGVVPLASLGSPELGVLASDLVEFTVDGTGGARCAELPVIGDPIAPGAIAALPGGALPLSAGPLACGGFASPGLDQAVPVTFTVRSSGLVLSSAGLGYLGRPVAGQPFALEWTSAADPDVFTTPATHAQLVDQVVARKARRRFYPIESLAHGPAIAFTVQSSTAVRGAKVTWSTNGGFTPMSRRPTSGAIAPVGATPIDRSQFPRSVGELEIRYYVAYSADQIFIFGPGEATSFFIR